MSDGYIHIPRNILERDWWKDKDMVFLYLYILASVNTKDCSVGGKTIKRGRMQTTLNSILKDNTALSKQTIRTCLKKLKEAGVIDIETTNRYSVITLHQEEQVEIKEEMQEKPKDEVKAEPQEVFEEPFVLTPDPLEAPKKTQEQIAADTKKRMKKFYDSLIPFVSVYGKEMMREFYEYWSEMNKSQSKMRWENERTWCVELRLRRWANNNKCYSNGNRRNETTQRLEGAANVINSFLAEN